jgi:phosphatidylglycerol---prolipoprotein diacylglyceryl transferase
MLPVVQIGPAAVQLPGLLLIAGVWLGSLLAERQARRLGLQAELVERLILVGLLVGVAGARLGYALRFMQVYLSDPLALLALSPVTLSPEVGLAVAGVAALVYAQRKGLPLWPTLDALTPGVAGFAVALALAHLASGDAFGAPAEVPWAIELWGARRHPSQAYELLAATAILWLLFRLRPDASFPGFAFGLFAALTAVARLLLESFRGDSVLWFGTLRTAQVVSLGILLAVLALLRKLAHHAVDAAA